MFLVLLVRLLTDCRRRNDDTSYSGKAIYLHVVEVFGVKRFYVGQARNLHKRIQDHMSSEKRQKEPSSLHYYALKHSTSDYYITLSYIPDANTCHGLGIRGDLENDSHLFLDLLETWCCLLFQALPKKYLEEFLPQDIPIHNPACRGLNIHLPLHGPALSNPGWHKIREIVRESSDRLYEDYLYDQALKFHSNNQQLVKHREAGLQICESLDGIPNNSSTPSRTTLPSPLSTKSKPVKYRPQSEAAKQVQPSTPCYPKSGRATNLPLDDASPYSKPADVGASNTDTSEQKKRKRDGDSLTEGDRLTKNRVNRILF